MTPLLRSRQRAEEFAAHVDGVAAGRPVADPATERLVGVAQMLRSQGAADEPSLPRAAFAAELRERLMTEAVTVLTPQHVGLALPTRTHRKRERRLVAAASVAVLLGGTASMATAAQSALPGQALYPVKRGIENAEAAFSTSPAGRGRDLLQHATGRLDEVRGLIAEDSATGTPQVAHTLADFTAQAREGADLLMGSYRDGHDPRTIVAVRSFTTSALRRIDGLAATAPTDAQPGLRDAALTLQAIDQRARRLCATCSDLPVLSLPESFLASAEVDRAMHRLQAATPDNSHPVIVDKRAVRRADAGASGPVRSGGQPGSGTPTSTAPVPPAATAPGLPKVEVKGDVKKLPLGNGLGGSLDDGLGDVVRTLLPEPQTDPLPTSPTDLLP